MRETISRRDGKFTSFRAENLMLLGVFNTLFSTNVSKNPALFQPGAFHLIALHFHVNMLL